MVATHLGGYGLTLLPDAEGMGSAVSVTDPQYGAVGDDEADDTLVIQRCLDENRIVYLPKPPVAYKVSGLKLNHQQVLIGPGRYQPCLRGDGTADVLQVDGLNISPHNSCQIFGVNVYVSGQRCVYCRNSPNLHVENCYLDSWGAGKGIEVFESWRIAILGSTIHGYQGGVAVEVVRQCNGTLISGNTITGGNAGTAIIAGYCHGTSIDGNIIESSLNGIMVSSHTAGPGGEVEFMDVTHGIKITNNYIEQSSKPISVGEWHTVYGCVVEGNVVENSKTFSIPQRTAAITFGLMRGGRIANNSLLVSETGGEDAYRFVVNEDVIIQNLDCEIVDNAIINTPDNLYTVTGLHAGNAFILRQLGAYNYFDWSAFTVSHGSQNLRTWTSETIDLNAGMPMRAWLPSDLLSFGGKGFVVEVIDAPGPLVAAQLRIGTVSSPIGLVNTDMSSLPIVNGRAEVPLVNVDGTLSPTDDNIIEVVGAGGGTQTCRVRIHYRAN